MARRAVMAQQKPCSTDSGCRTPTTKRSLPVRHTSSTGMPSMSDTTMFLMLGPGFRVRLRV